MEAMNIREMVIDDHGQILELMKLTSGVTVRVADSLGSTEMYLKRNPGLSFVAEHDARLVGCAMAGHDGRRGYLQHVIVASKYRGQGIARELIARCVSALHAQNIQKIHLDVLADNGEAIRFWQHLGWQKREDIVRYSLITSKEKNA